MREPFGHPGRIAQKIGLSANLERVDEPPDALEISGGLTLLVHHLQLYFSGY